MKTHTPASALTRGFAALLTAAACMLTFAAAPAVRAEASAATSAGHAAALPLKATRDKDNSGKNEAPYILTLTNESQKALKVDVRIDYSVVVHNRPKNKIMEGQRIDPGMALKLDNLAAEDKVTVTAEGYEPMTIKF